MKPETVKFDESLDYFATKTVVLLRYRMNFQAQTNAVIFMTQTANVFALNSINT